MPATTRKAPSHQGESDFPPGLAQPARRALASAGCERLKDLTRFTEAEVEALHAALAEAAEAGRAGRVSLGKCELQQGHPMGALVFSSGSAHPGAH
jgi:hypothetical protein